MGFFTKLQAAVERNNSLLCVGLDPNPVQAPARYQAADGNPTETIVAWNRAIIAQTQDLVCAYKPNIAFYEAVGAPGMEALRQTLAMIPSHIPSPARRQARRHRHDGGRLCARHNRRRTGLRRRCSDREPLHG